jgi:hypothetical protein
MMVFRIKYNLIVFVQFSSIIRFIKTFYCNKRIKKEESKLTQLLKLFYNLYLCMAKLKE